MMPPVFPRLYGDIPGGGLWWTPPAKGDGVFGIIEELRLSPIPAHALVGVRG